MSKEGWPGLLPVMPPPANANGDRLRNHILPIPLCQQTGSSGYGASTSMRNQGTHTDYDGKPLNESHVTLYVGNKLYVMYTMRQFIFSFFLIFHIVSSWMFTFVFVYNMGMWFKWWRLKMVDDLNQTALIRPTMQWSNMTFVLTEIPSVWDRRKEGPNQQNLLTIQYRVCRYVCTTPPPAYARYQLMW